MQCILVLKLHLIYAGAEGYLIFKGVLLMKIHLGLTQGN